jgi:hypothetical protein
MTAGNYVVILKELVRPPWPGHCPKIASSALAHYPVRHRGMVRCTRYAIHILFLICDVTDYQFTFRIYLCMIHLTSFGSCSKTPCSFRMDPSKFCTTLLFPLTSHVLVPHESRLKSPSLLNQDTSVETMQHWCLDHQDVEVQSGLHGNLQVNAPSCQLSDMGSLTLHE